MLRLNRSTWPFASGWYGEFTTLSISRRARSLARTKVANSFPPSLTSLRIALNRQTHSWTNEATVGALLSGMAAIITHLGNSSVMTATYFLSPSVVSGPYRLMCTLSNGAVGASHGVKGALGVRLSAIWHAGHAVMKSATTSAIVGQKYLCTMACKVLRAAQ